MFVVLLADIKEKNPDSVSDDYEKTNNCLKGEKLFRDDLNISGFNLHEFFWDWLSTWVPSVQLELSKVEYNYGLDGLHHLYDEFE